MAIAFVLGNGLSRKNINLAHLKNCGMIYGCNALYREFTPDVLVSTDRPISEAIQESGYALKNRFHTRRILNESGALPLIKEYFGYSSGPNAVGLAIEDGHQKIYMLGFDMGPSETDKFNNIYAGTEFYKSPDSAPTYTGNWAKQLKKIIETFPEVQFTRVYGKTTAKLPEFDSILNLEHLDLAIFLDRINNPKDL